MAHEKGFWWLMSWVWAHGKGTPANIAAAPAEISLTTRRGEDRTTIKQKDLHQSTENLGVFMNLLGTMAEEFNKHLDQSREIAERVITSPLQPEEVEQRFWGVWIPKTNYS
mmetsp:Transcript_45193/g.83632  ORF Transcript_45193/g.83632 Transcript_45193/m.83632 type:complete len:111 (+) Transcript_45193:1511-1843(+)